MFNKLVRHVCLSHYQPGPHRSKDGSSLPKQRPKSAAPSILPDPGGAKMELKASRRVLSVSLLPTQDQNVCSSVRGQHLPRSR